MSSEVREVRLPAQLCRDAESRFVARFGSLEQFLTFLLHEVLGEDAARVDQDERRVIEQRLKDLGYI